MAAKARWRGFFLYSSYLVSLIMVGSAVEAALLSVTAGFGLAVLLGAGMAVFWPRW